MPSYRVVSCTRELKAGEWHGGPIRHVDGQPVCTECWMRQRGVEPRRSKGRPVLCPKCGEVLMTRFRGGRVNIGSMRTGPGGTATLVCQKCGHEKRVRSPFGQPGREQLAAAKLRSQAIRAQKEQNNAGHA